MVSVAWWQGGLCLDWASLRGFWNATARGRVPQPLGSGVALQGLVGPLLCLLGTLGWGYLSMRSPGQFPARGWGSWGEASPARPFSASPGRPGSGQPVAWAVPPQAEIIALQPPWQPPPPAELTALARWGTLLSPGPLPRTQ